MLLDPCARDAVDRAVAQFADKLVGVLAFGSYPRGAASASSDFDTLVVIDESLPLTRSLYRDWDAVPPGGSNRTLDPHFVHIPTLPSTGAGAWCEAAIDGVVLVERNGALTRHLAAVRAEIAAGHFIRRVVHGQPYWAVAA
ncbi:MAG: nucleotidyltransferase domain-containing protein [Acidobacteriota bacterium]